MTDIKVFSKEWFKKYNKAITWVARLPILGELIFNFKKYGHYVDRKKLCEVTPNSVVEYLGTKGEKAELRQHFFVRNEYALRLQKVFYPIWITFHIWDIVTRPIPQLNLGFDTLTVYPDAGSGSTTCDTYFQKNADYMNGATWANIRIGDASYIYNTSGNYSNLCGFQTSITSLWRNFYRSMYTIDTSSLTANATISSAIFSIYGESKSDPGSNTPDIDLYLATPTNSATLAVGDYTKIGTVSQTGTAITYTNFSITGYNNFTLLAPGNTEGCDRISLTGISKFGIRNANYDVAATEPTWGSNQYTGFIGTQSDAGSNKPKLVVTYTVPVTFIPRTMWFN